MWPIIIGSSLQSMSAHMRITRYDFNETSINIKPFAITLLNQEVGWNSPVTCLYPMMTKCVDDWNCVLMSLTIIGDWKINVAFKPFIGCNSSLS